MPRDHSADLDAILAAALRAAEPRAAVAVAVQGNPPRASHPALIAVGKAAPAMALGFRDAAPGVGESIMVVPAGTAAPPSAVISDHPFPTPRCIHAAQQVRSFVESIVAGPGAHDGFVVLMSGGASSLLTWPMPGLHLADYAAAMRALIAGGMDIRTLNCIRKHCEELKGGRLALRMGSLPCDTYILSDVIGDDLSAVGSGPTLPDATTFAQACAALEQRPGLSAAARVLLPHLRAGAAGKHPETPKSGELPGACAVLVANNDVVVHAAAACAEGNGRRAVRQHTATIGDAATAGQRIAAEVLTGPRPATLIFGGEATVDVQGRPGRGGRNQELALAAAMALDGSEGITLAAMATDGVDGPTDAAGAVVTGRTCAQARALGLDPGAALADHDSHTFFAALDRAGHRHLLRTGPTGTNVNDVVVVLAD